jgi:hypothetical protein
MYPGNSLNVFAEMKIPGLPRGTGRLVEGWGKVRGQFWVES